MKVLLAILGLAFMFAVHADPVNPAPATAPGLDSKNCKPDAIGNTNPKADVRSTDVSAAPAKQS